MKEWIGGFYTEASDRYEAISACPVSESAIKLIAFYLPQFHPIPENDRWWGRGFTEWTNVSKAKPQFFGHYQPHLPGELGFYDLRLTEVQRRQIELAKHFGIYGFCYYYYWFNGKHLLDLPLKRILEDRDLDLPFCICWANENWTRKWDGQEQELLLQQSHSVENDFKFIEDIVPILKDERYIKISNKPLLIVYRPDILPDLKRTVLRWREYCVQLGVGEVYLVAARTFGFENPTALGFDAAIEFPPHGLVSHDITDEISLLNPFFEGRIFSYPEIIENKRTLSIENYPVFRTVIPAWDNTARRRDNANIFWGSSPRLYQTWLESACADANHQFSESSRFVFVNAWNEWAEGAHLEPDRRYGYAYLNATANALRKYTRRSKQRNRSNHKRISVIVPAYNHEKYIRKALESLEAQTTKDFEVILVDDGSTDSTNVVVQDFVKSNNPKNIRLVNQSNAGAHSAINRGISEAEGDYIAILNSDDFYDSARLEILQRVLEESDSLLAFSDIAMVGGDDDALASEDSVCKLLKGKISQIPSFPSIGYALLDFNIAITTGNFFFKRELFDLVGGFSALKYCHDWDFALTALRYTTPLFLSKPLYYYRLHAENSFRKLSDMADKESQHVLLKFFKFEQNEGQVRRDFPSHKNDPQYFAQFVKQHKYERYVREGLEA
jgi:glycosyltransferase involved in cell wall biosynthesis